MSVLVRLWVLSLMLGICGSSATPHTTADASAPVVTSIAFTQSAPPPYVSNCQGTHPLEGYKEGFFAPTKAWQSWKLHPGTLDPNSDARNCIDPHVDDTEEVKVAFAEWIITILTANTENRATAIDTNRGHPGLNFYVHKEVDKQTGKVKPTFSYGPGVG